MYAARELIDFLKSFRNSSTVIMGIGNTLKGDDAAGSLVCERLKSENISADVINAATVPENYIQTIIKKSPRNLIVIDAVSFDAAPGAIKVFQTEQLDSMIISTHTLSPRVFIDMIQQSIVLEVIFIGIQPGQTQLGSPLSAQVSRAIEELAQVLLEAFPPKT
jgi:hydrogenase maturation protease HycI